MENNNNHRADIMRAAIELVAEDGICAVTTRQVARRAGVSDGLMYRFFKSKNDLLLSCLYLVTDNIIGEFYGLMKIQADTLEEFEQEVRERWNMFFSFLVKHVPDTLFFYEYANSAGMMKLARAGTFSIRDFTRMLADKLGAGDPKFTHVSEEDIPYFWLYYIHVSMIFAVRTIRGELSDTEESRDKIWRLVTNGLSAYLFSSPGRADGKTEH